LSSVNARRSSGAGRSGAGGATAPHGESPQPAVRRAAGQAESSKPGCSQPAGPLSLARHPAPPSTTRVEPSSKPTFARMSTPAGLGAPAPGGPLRAAIASTFSPARGAIETSRGCRHASGSSTDCATRSPLR
jgi:hypothetical protein